MIVCCLLVAGQLELFQKGISEMSGEDNEFGDDAGFMSTSNIDGEEEPLNGQRLSFPNNNNN